MIGSKYLLSGGSAYLSFRKENVANRGKDVVKQVDQEFLSLFNQTPIVSLLSCEYLCKRNALSVSIVSQTVNGALSITMANTNVGCWLIVTLQ